LMPWVLSWLVGPRCFPHGADGGVCAHACPACIAPQAAMPAAVRSEHGGTMCAPCSTFVTARTQSALAMLSRVQRPGCSSCSTGGRVLPSVLLVHAPSGCNSAPGDCRDCACVSVCYDSSPCRCPSWRRRAPDDTLCVLRTVWRGSDADRGSTRLPVSAALDLLQVCAMCLMCAMRERHVVGATAWCARGAAASVCVHGMCKQTASLVVVLHSSGHSSAAHHMGSPTCTATPVHTNNNETSSTPSPTQNMHSSHCPVTRPFHRRQPCSFGTMCASAGQPA
jgi:hypothetical protein